LNPNWEDDSESSVKSKKKILVLSSPEDDIIKISDTISSSTPIKSSSAPPFLVSRLYGGREATYISELVTEIREKGR
jgi:hypothetical protein